MKSFFKFIYIFSIALTACTAFAGKFPINHPKMNGIIINNSGYSLQVVFNDIKVPNHFPKTVTGSVALYDVSPIGSPNAAKWTKTILYSDGHGGGCYLQFAWDPVTKSPLIAVIRLNGNSECEVDDGFTTITIGGYDTKSKARH